MLLAIGIASTIDGTSGQGLLHEHRQQNPHTEDETVTPMSDFDEEAGRFCPLAVQLCRQSILLCCALPQSDLPCRAPAPALSWPCSALACPALPCPALPCPALPCPALPCPALPCPALPCPALRKTLKALFRISQLLPNSHCQDLIGRFFWCCSWHSLGGDISDI